MHMMTLYTRTGCPFCAKVLSFASENNLELDVRDIIEHPEFESEMMAQGGKTQTPLLVDSEAGIVMYESDDIVAYLGDKLRQG